MIIPPETLAWLRQSAATEGAAYSQVLLIVLERLELLERKYETQRLAPLEWGKDVDMVKRWSDDHLRRLEALEQPRQDKLDRLIEQDREDDEHTPEAVPMATDEELRLVADAQRLWSDSRRAVYLLGRQHGAAQARCPHIRSSDEGSSYCALAEQTAAAHPTPPVAPAGGLVERVAAAMHPDSFSPEESWGTEARAAIREVAAWLEEHNSPLTADWLREEADQ